MVCPGDDAAYIQGIGFVEFRANKTYCNLMVHTLDMDIIFNIFSGEYSASRDSRISLINLRKSVAPLLNNTIRYRSLEKAPRRHDSRKTF
jgi:hypothetical protein